MQIQPIKIQPNFNGKVVLKPNNKTNLTADISNNVWRSVKEVANMVSNKPYNIYISKNKENSDFYNVAANKSYKNAQKIKEYTVKVKSNIIAESLVDAAKDAMEMYEKYIVRGAKG